MIDKILNTAIAEIGTKAKKDFTCKYTEAYGYKGNWCVMFVWWVFRECGLSDLFYDGKKVASCTSFFNWALSKNMLVTEPKKGDIIIFKFKEGLHMGICENYDGKYITSIDGNTCASGNEYSGGEVLRRKRSKSYILYIIRPDYNESSTSYTVQKGDSLWKIAVKFYGKGILWKKIYDYNNLKSTVIKVGMKLNIPKEV